MSQVKAFGKISVAPFKFIHVKPLKGMIEISVGSELGTTEIKLPPDQAQTLSRMLDSALREAIDKVSRV